MTKNNRIYKTVVNKNVKVWDVSNIKFTYIF